MKKRTFSLPMVAFLLFILWFLEDQDKMPKKDIEQRVREIAKTVELSEEQLERNVSELSFSKICPSEGTLNPAIAREQVGIVNKGENADYSVQQAFVDWFGGAELQAKWAANFGTIPALAGAKKDVNPRTKEIVDQFKPMNVDWSFVNEHLDEWLEKIELELMPM